MAIDRRLKRLESDINRSSRWTEHHSDAELLLLAGFPPGYVPSEEELQALAVDVAGAADSGSRGNDPARPN
jgi:hypothetical protein